MDSKCGSFAMIQDLYVCMSLHIFLIFSELLDLPGVNFKQTTDFYERSIAIHKLASNCYLI